MTFINDIADILNIISFNVIKSFGYFLVQLYERLNEHSYTKEGMKQYNRHFQNAQHFFH